MAERLYSADFERFVLRHFAARGRAWLDQLPARVERYARLWHFEIEQHLAGGLMSCCLAVVTSDGTAAVFKLDGPWTPAQPEIAALTLWSGKPAPLLLRSDGVGGALLIERIEPGSMFEGGAAAADAQWPAELLRELHAPSPTSTLVGDWSLKIFDEDQAAQSSPFCVVSLSRRWTSTTWSFNSEEMFAGGEGLGRRSLG